MNGGYVKIVYQSDEWMRDNEIPGELDAVIFGTLVGE